MASVISRPRDNPSIIHSVVATTQYRYQDYCTLINRRPLLPGIASFLFLFHSFHSCNADSSSTTMVGERKRERASGAYLIPKKWPDRLSRHLTFLKSLEMYPTKIMKPLFHLFSFHFISSPASSYRIVSSRLI